MVLSILISICFVLLFYKSWKSSQYFKNNGVKHEKPLLLLGNMLDIILQRVVFVEKIQQWYYQFENERLFGFYQFFAPTIIIKDLKLIKKIGVSDFDHFVDHQILSEGSDSLWNKLLFTSEGDRWRHMRSTLSSTFTGSKMKLMLGLMSDCSKRFVKHFSDQNVETVTVELKDIFSRYTNDVIATCAFGIECDSLENPDNEFYTRGYAMTNFSGINILKIFAFTLCPSLMKLLKIKLISNADENFFKNVITETIKVREARGIVRPDMIHLLIQAKNGQQIKEDTHIGSEDAISDTSDTKFGSVQITDDDIISQAFGFFFAGFDTASTLITYVGYELAVNKDMQDKLREEIKNTNNECNGVLTYEGMMKMKYMDMIICEALRKWPSNPITDRLCTKDYTIQPENPGESKVTIYKGTQVWFPIYSIHRDEKYYPDPENFDPERFRDKSNIDPATFLSFGIGPRNCLGSRFAQLQTKAVIFHLLNAFEIVAVEKSVIPPKLSKKHYNMSAEDGMWFGLKRRIDLKCNNYKD